MVPYKEKENKEQKSSLKCPLEWLLLRIFMYISIHSYGGGKYETLGLFFNSHSPHVPLFYLNLAKSKFR